MTSKKFLEDIGIEVLGTIIGGVLLSLLFFIFSDYVFKPPNLNGKWALEVKVENTSFSKFKGLIVYFDVMLNQEGDKVFGTGEKVKEILNGEIKEYDGNQRTQIEISGYIDRNFLSKDKLSIHTVEEGYKRKSSAFYELVRFDDNYMEGFFQTTAADSSGIAKWKKEKINPSRKL